MTSVHYSEGSYGSIIAMARCNSDPANFGATGRHVREAVRLPEPDAVSDREPHPQDQWVTYIQPANLADPAWAGLIDTVICAAPPFEVLLEWGHGGATVWTTVRPHVRGVAVSHAARLLSVRAYPVRRTDLSPLGIISNENPTWFPWLERPIEIAVQTVRGRAEFRDLGVSLPGSSDVTNGFTSTSIVPIPRYAESWIGTAGFNMSMRDPFNGIVQSTTTVAGITYPFQWSATMWNQSQGSGTQGIVRVHS